MGLTTRQSTICQFLLQTSLLQGEIPKHLVIKKGISCLVLVSVFEHSCFLGLHDLVFVSVLMQDLKYTIIYCHICVSPTPFSNCEQRPFLYCTNMLIFEWQTVFGLAKHKGTGVRSAYSVLRLYHYSFRWYWAFWRNVRSPAIYCVIETGCKAGFIGSRRQVNFGWQRHIVAT